jgi:hypothetical protein
VLRVEKVAVSLPPNAQVPIASTHAEAVKAMEAEDVQEEIADQDEEA